MDGGASDRVLQSWQQLWDATGGGESCRIEDAAMVFNLGYAIRRRQGDYRGAARYLEAYFCHPDIQNSHETVRADFKRQLALAVLDTGDEFGAVRHFEELLAFEHATPHLPAAAALNALHGYCEEQPEETVAPAAVSDLVLRVLRRRRGPSETGPKSGEALTFGELLDLIDPE